MFIIVLMKQVPDTTEIRIDPKTGTLIREGVESIINPDDKHAIELAATLKKDHGGKAMVFSMGPPQAIDAISEAMAMGIDEGILLTDRNFGGADTWATAFTLGMAIRKLKSYDLIICGRQAIDGDTAQIGPQVAEFLGLPQLTHMRTVNVAGDTITGERETDEGVLTLEASLPAVVSVHEKINEPRFPSFKGIMAAKKKEVRTLTLDEIGVGADEAGLANAGSQVLTAAPRPAKSAGEKVSDEGEGGRRIAEYLVAQKLV